MKKEDGDHKGVGKTILDTKKIFQKKGAAIALSFAAALAAPLALTGCDQAPDDGGAESTYNVPEDIAKIDPAYKDSNLVQGKKACIEKLIENGETEAEATKTCDELTEEAMKAAKQAQPLAATAAPATTVHHDNSAMNNMMFWYLMTRNNSPAVYQGDNNSGLSRVYGGGGSAGAMAAAPAHITPMQTTYLNTPEAQRPAVAQTMAARPGVRVVPVSTPHGSSSTTHFTSRGGLGGHGIGSGG